MIRLTIMRAGQAGVRHLALMCRKIEILGGMLMPVTAFQATVENGQVRLPANVQLPENARVYVVVPDFDPNAGGKRFDLAEMISRMPSDYQPSEESFGAPVGREEW